MRDSPFGMRAGAWEGLGDSDWSQIMGQNCPCIFVPATGRTRVTANQCQSLE